MTTISASKGGYFVISMAASDHDDTQVFYTDEIETDDEFGFGFWAIDNNYDSDGMKLDEEDCTGIIFINPAQVVSVEQVDCEGETEEEPVEEKPITQKYASRSVDEIPQKKKKGWF